MCRQRIPCIAFYFDCLNINIQIRYFLSITDNYTFAPFNVLCCIFIVVDARRPNGVNVNYTSFMSLFFVFACISELSASITPALCILTSVINNYHHARYVMKLWWCMLMYNNLFTRRLRNWKRRKMLSKILACTNYHCNTFYLLLF